MIVNIPIGDLKPNTYNPNKYGEREFEMLCKSIREDGFTIPCVVRKSDNMIVDGEHRWKAAQVVGYKSLPCFVVDMNDEQMKIATLRHNRARGKEDIDLVTAVLKDLAKMGVLEDIREKLILAEEDVTRLLHELETTAEKVDSDFQEQYSKAKDFEVQQDVSDIVISKTKVFPGMGMDVFRFNFTFFDEDAIVAEKVFGLNPAVRLLEMCRMELDGANI